ncbi:cupin domain-containing protein [Candidatus Binatia bacterium]|nr:cupin domain-containing protein [Candidatus Binatia bacterium]
MALALATACERATPTPQDLAQPPPDAYRCTLQNERVRVCEIELAPGASAPMHAHPEHVAYMLTAGRLRISTPDGRETEWESKPGYTALAPPERHALVNVGDTAVRGVIVEFLAPLGGTP